MRFKTGMDRPEVFVLPALWGLSSDASRKNGNPGNGVSG